MVDEQEPAKRVVKRVVKKTVVRPPQLGEPRPQVRYGRPVATATKPSQATPKATAQVRPKPAAASRPARPSLDLGARAGSARDRVVDGWWVVADATGTGARASGRFVATRARAVAAYRLPHLNAYLASVVTGVVVGLFAVAAGAVSLAVFESVRGVAGGGGRWGGLVFVVVCVAGYVLGAALLRGFGAASARLTSFLGVVLAIVAILVLFLRLADSPAALVLLPLLGAVTYAAGHWVADLAENTPAVVE